MAILVLVIKFPTHLFRWVFFMATVSQKDITKTESPLDKLTINEAFVFEVAGFHTELSV